VRGIQRQDKKYAWKYSVLSTMLKPKKYRLDV
jgi:hypothetical protein